jgi:predicted RNA-binding protein YlqC (UPF0109 family)
MINYVELIKSLIMPLVIYENQVEVKSETLEDGTTSVNVNVADADLGRVIGKGGKIATSIRTIVYAAASKENEKVKVNIDGKE